MRNIGEQERKFRRRLTALAVLSAVALLSPLALQADKQKKKKDAAAATSNVKSIDYSYIVWPNPPAIARIKYTNWYSADKVKRNLQGNVQKKNKWMDRLAGTQTSDEVFNMPFQLIQPYGLAVDS